MLGKLSRDCFVVQDMPGSERVTYTYPCSGHPNSGHSHGPSLDFRGHVGRQVPRFAVLLFGRCGDGCAAPPGAPHLTVSITPPRSAGAVRHMPLVSSRPSTPDLAPNSDPLLHHRTLLESQRVSQLYRSRCEKCAEMFFVWCRRRSHPIDNALEDPSLMAALLAHYV